MSLTAFSLNCADFVDERVPFGGVFLDHVRRLRKDANTIWRSIRHPDVVVKDIKWLTVEVTNLCNSNCRFCGYQYQSVFRKTSGFIASDMFEKVVRDFAQMGGTHLGLTPFSGEPLLDNKLICKIRLAKDLGLRVGLFTNGILLDKVNLEEFLLSGIDGLTISSGPLDKDMYRALYRNPNYDRVLAGIEKLYLTRNRIRPSLAIGIAFRSHVPRRIALATADFTKRILPLMTPEDLSRSIVNTRGYDPWGGLITKTDMIGNMRLALKPLVKNRSCSWTYNLYVTWDGQVRACPCRYGTAATSDGDDGLLLGTLDRSRLAEIWTSDRLQQLRKSFSTHTLPLTCKECTMYSPT